MRAELGATSGDIRQAFAGLPYGDKKARLQVSEALTQEMIRRNMHGSDLMANKAEFGAQSQAIKQAETRVVAVERLEDSVKKLGPKLDALAEKGLAQGVKITNMPINKLRTYFSDTDLSALRILTTEIPTQYMEAMTMPGSNAQMHEGARTAGTLLMNEDMTYEELMNNYHTMVDVMANNHEALRNIVQREIARVGKSGGSSSGASGGWSAKKVE
jgi:hypothetical protein